MRTRRKSLYSRGFTTVELLVVIGILVVLAGLVFVGVHRVSGTTKDRSTRVTLRNLNGMLAELETANALRKQPSAWLWWNGSATVIEPADGPPAPAGSSYNFWKTPYFVTVGTEVRPDSLASPGQVTEDKVAQRNGSIAVVNTSIAMSQLAAVPANRSALDQLPPQQKMTPAWTADPVGTAGPDLFAGYNPDGTASARYAAGARVTHLGAFYVRTPANPTTNPPPAAGSSEWSAQTAVATNVPVVLDSWNNPIIFVPASGLRVRVLNGQKTNASADATQNFIVISPEGSVTGQYTAAPEVQRVGRPFFASAGPDGDFTTGDDNVYSFEQ